MRSGFIGEQCRSVAAWMENLAAEKIRAMSTPPVLSFVYSEDDEAAARYVRQKVKACKRVGIVPQPLKYPARFGSIAYDIPFRVAVREACYTSDGVIIQEPFPDGLGGLEVRRWLSRTISPEQDVDGLYHRHGFMPCTALGIYFLLRSLYGDAMTGRRAVVIGRSKAVGLPIAEMLSRRMDMDTLVLHSKSAASHWQAVARAPVVISAVGQPGVVGMLAGQQAGRTIIDVGFTVGEDGKIHGDVDPELAKTSRVTPVPGGVGPLTVAALMLNTAYGHSPLDLWTEMDRLGAR